MAIRTAEEWAAIVRRAGRAERRGLEFSLQTNDRRLRGRRASEANGKFTPSPAFTGTRPLTAPRAARAIYRKLGDGSDGGEHEHA